MSRGKRLLVLLTFNESEALPKVFDRLPLSVADEVVAVDGGSKDGTVEFLKSKGLKVLGQPRRGRGVAFRVALEASDAETICYYSPDGNEDPADIPHIVDGLAAGHDMVIASRFMPGARSEDDDKFLFASRRWGNLLFTWLVNVLCGHGGTHIHDTINGYRGITRAAFRRLAPDAEGYAIEFQMSIRALQLGLRVLEFPTQESPRIGRGVSKLNAIPVGLKFLGLLVREWARPRVRR